jgi:hypothetical protein
MYLISFIIYYILLTNIADYNLYSVLLTRLFLHADFTRYMTIITLFTTVTKHS